MGQTRPKISVIIPTFNRAVLLQASLESLCVQSIPHADFEVVVISDGSTDRTAQVCEEYASRLRLRYFRIENSGISAAKNLGLFTASAPIILFFDDDDTAHPALLQRHIETHERNPDENVAVLGYTTWAPTLDVSPLMEYILEIGEFLFCYKHLSDGDILDFSYFWGGRSSCKRSLLAKHGAFNQDFRAIIEDIELAYRLSKFGLKVIFNRHAVSYMIRSISFEDFCRRSERQGKAMVLFSQLHPELEARQYCKVPEPISCDILESVERWRELEPIAAQNVHRVHELEAALSSNLPADKQRAALSEVRTLYRWLINACKVKGAANTIMNEPAPLGQLADAVASA